MRGVLSKLFEKNLVMIAIQIVPKITLSIKQKPKFL
jgi:hypothetical protein